MKKRIVKGITRRNAKTRTSGTFLDQLSSGTLKNGHDQRGG